MIQVLVTGSEGQLGKCFQNLVFKYAGLNFDFKSSTEMDITNVDCVMKILKDGKYHYCLNCAAYTNVETAESEVDKAFSVNATGVLNVAEACLKNDVTLIHISTDYVFDGKNGPYTISDMPNPINVYGASKLMGEQYVQNILNNYFIVRTSWLYSEYGNNFYKTILRMANYNDVLEITDEQTGCPTDANNLAIYIIDLIISKKENYGIHHFSGNKPMTWYDFAKKILAENNLGEKVSLVKAKNYRTFARRPINSVLK